MRDALATQLGRAVAVGAWDLLMTPWWWYSRGLVRVVSWGGASLRGWEHVVGLGLWARSLFVPMFGQTDWQGRIISFVMRVVVLVGRILQVLLGAILVIAVILAYLVLPPFLAMQIIRSALGGM